MKPMTVVLVLALTATAALFIACGNDDDGGATPSPSAAGDGDEDLFELQLTAEDTQFDPDSLEAPAASEVSLTVDNRDSIEHNFSLYESAESDEPLFEGPLFAGPSFLIYQFTAPEAPGSYQFRCDVHPDAMKGDFIVEQTAPSGTQPGAP
jgi:plastocyanin